MIVSSIFSLSNSNVFGSIKNIVYDIDLVDSPVFKLHAAWRIPYAIKDAVKAEQYQVQN